MISSSRASAASDAPSTGLCVADDSSTAGSPACQMLTPLQGSRELDAAAGGICPVAFLDLALSPCAASRRIRQLQCRSSVFGV